MTIQSMTGFARSDGALGDATWHWELRSVNSRSLDLRLKLPPGYESIEPKIREGVSRRITRGSVNASLSVVREGSSQQLRINEKALEQITALAVRVGREIGSPPPRAESLLTLKGVIEVVEEAEGEEQVAARNEAMITSLTAALDGLVAARLEEGGRLKGVIAAQLDEIERLVASVESAPSRSVEAIRRKLFEQVSRLMEANQSFDPMRLHQEAVLLATKADVEEELKRLRAHLAAARGLLASQGGIGRKLDFLTQEFNREANTLTSKAADNEIAHAGLALKVVIDQMREQVQNIE